MNLKTDMIAKLPDTRPWNGRNLSSEKELVHAISVVGAVKGETSELITARFWMGRSRNASRVYCSVWLRDGEGGAGHGTASGYGYDKKSAALSEALESAGITLSKDISGVGESAMRDALVAVVIAMGAEPQVYVTHG